ncbi:MAG: hypothetical protein RMM98_03280 [Acidobacteriota bacterium]|nr:hypothetical protein [Blastocatellia bacterium]MDW8238615.1 hypothetical protein [Acidobacteriota bacterium]
MQHTILDTRQIAFPIMLALLLTLGLTTSTAYAQSTSPEEPTPQQGPVEGFKLGGLITSGTIEMGTRQTWIGGNQDVYRSQVNLGAGVRLFDIAVQSRSPDNAGPLYDTLSYHMTSWGGDPYNTVRLSIQKRHLYRFDLRYWRMDYVNLLPTFANPLVNQGLLINQHSFNQARRVSSYWLTLLPNRDFQIRLGYERNFAFGQALTTFSIGLDEFVLQDPMRTTTNDYLVGVDTTLGMVDLTIEQTFRTFKDDMTTFQTPGLINNGNSPRVGPIGAVNPQQILLTSFQRDSAVRGFMPATRLGLNIRPSKQVQFTGRVVYSDAEFDFNRNEILSGNLFDLSALSFVTRQRSNALAAASRPITTADTALRVSPIERLTLTNSTSFNHFVIAGGSLLETLQILGLTFQGTPPPPNQMQRLVSSFLDERTSLRSLRNLFEASLEAHPRLTLRGGYRFTNRRARLTIPVPFRAIDQSSLDTHTGIAGLTLRAPKQFRLMAQLERGSADNVFTRIAPYHLTRLRVRSSFQPLSQWRLSGEYTLTDARNPNPFVDTLHRHRAFNIHSTVSLNERLDMDLGYTRVDISSDTSIILNPRTLERGNSPYRADDNAVNADLTFSPSRRVHLSVGYGVINSKGTFPLNYHQPRARLSLDLHRRLSWIASWGWYGYNEKGVAIQDYRAHLLSSSLKLRF